MAKESALPKEGRDPSPNEEEPRKGMRSCDGRELKRLLDAGLAWLDRHTTFINSLNVYPVPDGDTGTNMLLTMQAALEEMARSPEHSASAIAHAAAQGALMGARGNSGVILSQVLRGFAKKLDDKNSFNATEFAAALEEGSKTAYHGVIKPVEGTILTVAREAAEAALDAAEEKDDLVYVWEKTVAAAKESVAKTPLLLDVLREAGVVDAGGQGLFVILEGGLRLLQGKSVEAAPPLEAVVGLELEMMGEYGYDTQFVLRGENLDLEEIKAKITSMGESVLVVGDSNLIKVHVHTDRPGAVIDYATNLGSLSKITIENMQEQYQEFIAGQVKPPLTAEEISDIATVAVVSGPGLSRVFESLGVSAIVPGGQTMNPSTEELLNSIEAVRANNVIVLPNNENVILAAQQAQQLSAKDVAIVPTKTIPQGVSAILAFNYQADLETNVKAMEKAIRDIQTAEVTTATRSTQINGLRVRASQAIGLSDGKLTAAGDKPEEVVLHMLRQMKAEDDEIITIYYGQGVSRSQAEGLADEIRKRYPEQEIELVEGGQPHYHYIVSSE